MARSVAMKMGIRAGSRALFVNAPEAVIATLELPALEVGVDSGGGQFDYIHLFTTNRAEMTEAVGRLEPRLAPSGMLWVSWPKGRRLNTDLTLPTVIEIGYELSLVESTCLRVDDTWAGLKFTHPRKGVVYNNSYGTLPGARPPGQRE